MASKSLNEYTISQLLELYNRHCGEGNELKTFRNKETAIRRVREVMPKTKKGKTTGNGSPGRPRNVFDLAPAAEIKTHREGTKRARVLLMLRGKGATIEEVEKAIGWDHATAYEGVKLLHTHLGYGLRQDAKTGIIRATTREEERGAKKQSA